MKKFTSKFTVKFLLSLLSLLVITFIACTFFTNFSYKKYTAVCNTLLKEELSDDSISLHFTLANPEAYQITTSQIVLPSLKKEDRVKQNARLEEHLNSLSKLRTESWTYPQQLSTKSCHPPSRDP